MLVLSRREGEAIYIGDEIVVKIASVGGGKVRLAIDAPEDVRIDREEVYRRRREFQQDPARPTVCPAAS